MNPADAVNKFRLLAMLEDVAGSLDEHCSAPLEPEPFQHLDVVVPPPLGPVPTRDREPTLFVEVIDEHPYTRGVRMRLQYRPPVISISVRRGISAHPTVTLRDLEDEAGPDGCRGSG